MLCLIILLFFVILPGSDPVDPTKEARLATNFTVRVFHRSDPVAKFRSLHRLPSGDILLVKAVAGNDPKSEILLLWDDDSDGVADGFLTIVDSGYDLTHGIEYLLPENYEQGNNSGLLLASSSTTVWAWPFVDGERAKLGQGTILVKNINAASNADDLGADQGHNTRTLALSPGDQRYLYISVGSLGNIDPNSFRARIRSFDLRSRNIFDLQSGNTFDFRTGAVYADGLRNEVGLTFDDNGVLWGVENSGDRLVRDDLGGVITEDNPAEELNRFDGAPGTHYGYPWCWTEYSLPEGIGKGRGTVWAWPDTMSTSRNDEWCRNNTKAPALAMQAHSAPLGITFYNYNAFEPEANSDCTGRFPRRVNGHAFVAFHGSWNREVPTGYKVVRIPFDNGSPRGPIYNLFCHAGKKANWASGVRPVDVEFDRCGRLLVSDDGSGRVFTISYKA